jgi:hypothetical protein
MHNDSGLRGLGRPARWPSFPEEEENLNYREWVAARAVIAAALNDRDRSQIGDPREKQYKVAVRFESIKEALVFARQLAPLGIAPSTTIIHDEVSGYALGAVVKIYGKEAQRTLLDLVCSDLDEPRREQLQDLVLARGPIPEDHLERMAKGRARGWSHSKIAEKMNKQGIIAGMGGVRWTPQKVKNHLKKYDERQSMMETAGA